MIARAARDKLGGCATSVAFFALALAVYLLVPTEYERYLGIVFGGVLAVVGLLAARMGVGLSFGFSFLPWWFLGLVIASVGCWQVWRWWGLVGAIPIGGLAVGLAIHRTRRALAAEGDGEGSRPSEEDEPVRPP